MVRIVATFRVEDLDRWEAGFQRHGELFRQQGVISPLRYDTATQDNRVVLNGECEDLERLLESLRGEEAAAAMAEDGIVEGSFRLFVTESEFSF